MNKNLNKLFELVAKKEKIILSLMSRLPQLGLDLTLCRVSGCGLETKVELLHHSNLPYNDNAQHLINEVTSKNTISSERLCLLHTRLANIDARMVLQALEQWQLPVASVDCLASHGHTFYHAPKRMHLSPHVTSATFQIGDADHLAYKTGIISLSDFRQKHVAAGGEGAHLEAYGDYLLFSKKGENRILLHIGEIAAFTFLPASHQPEEVLASDTGPGYVMIDLAVSKNLPPLLYDDEGQIARSGKIRLELLDQMKKDPFFKHPLPKSTGVDLFNMHFYQEAQKVTDTLMLNPKDLIATLTRFTAETIAEELLLYFSKLSDCKIYLSGGGAKNATLHKWLRELLPSFTFFDFDELGFAPEAKRNINLTVLANETLSNDGFLIGKDPKAMPPVNFGKISFPY